MKSGYEAYGQIHKSTLSGRPLEGEAFMKAVRLLMRAQDFPGNNRLLVEALTYTRKLWTILQADLKSPANRLDDGLKSRLLSLSLFVDQQCISATKKPHPHEVLQGLIDINKDMASGLLG